jgi:DNA topoisomerase IB
MSTVGTHTEEVLDCVQTKVTQNMKESLAAPFSREEVWVALKDMGELKALGWMACRC